MKSYLISAFVRTHSHLDEESFRMSEPSSWLVWEAGPWKPGGARTLTSTTPPSLSVAPVAAGAEALAYTLAPKDPTKDQVTLCRNPICDIVINDGTVSMLHLVFMRAENGWTVQDSGSRNGSSLSGAPLEGKPKPLISTARIVAGSVAFSFYEPKDMLWRLKQYR